MNDDPFEKVRVDLQTALTELTDSTRARLDGIGAPPPPHVDAAAAVVEHRPERAATDDVPAPPRPGNPPVRARRAVRTPAVRVVAPVAAPAEPAPVAPVPAVAVASAPVEAPEEAVPPTRPKPPRARPITPPPTEPRPLRTPPDPGHGTRRRLLVAAGLVALLVLVVAAGFWASRPAPVAQDPPTASSSGELPAAPADAPDPGRLVLAEPQADGSVQVTQWLTFASPVRDVVVAAPTSRRDDARLTTATVEGRGVATVRLTGVVAPQQVTFRGATDRVRVRYTVRDAVGVSGQDDRRGLLDLPTVSVASQRSDAGPTVLQVQGARVLGVACGRTLGTVRPCGSDEGGAWGLESPSVDSTAVLATVDMTP